MPSASIERRTQNEVMFREVNETIKGMNEAFEELAATPSEFVCECDMIGCIDHVRVGVSEYARIRRDRTLFVVKVGHEGGVDLERVVERTEDFLVVQKAANDLTA